MREADKSVLVGVWPVIGGVIGGVTALAGERVKSDRQIREAQRAEDRARVRAAFDSLLLAMSKSGPDPDPEQYHAALCPPLLGLISTSDGSLQETARQSMDFIDQGLTEEPAHAARAKPKSSWSESDRVDATTQSPAIRLACTHTYDSINMEV
jgi:hypothetical protein